jgi:hypothetical protein
VRLKNETAWQLQASNIIAMAIVRSNPGTLAVLDCFLIRFSQLNFD